MNILITQVSKFGAMSWIKCLKRISSMDITLYGCDIYDKELLYHHSLFFLIVR